MRVWAWNCGCGDTLQHRLYTYSDRSGEPEQRRQSGVDANDRESRRNSTPKPDLGRNTRNAPNEALPWKQSTCLKAEEVPGHPERVG